MTKFKSSPWQLATLSAIVIIMAIAGIISYLQTNYKLNKLKVGSVLLVKGSYESGKESKAKVLAIDTIEGKKIYSLKIGPVGNPTFTTAKNGMKIDTSSIGSLPIYASSLAKWNFEIIGQEEVSNSELENYQYWKNNAKGGAF